MFLLSSQSYEKRIINLCLDYKVIQDYGIIMTNEIRLKWKVILTFMLWTQYEMVDTTKRTRRMRIKIEFKVLKRIKIEL